MSCNARRGSAEHDSQQQALEFVNRVKEAFHGDPQVYNCFLTVLDQLSRGVVEKEIATGQILVLLANHEGLRRKMEEVLGPHRTTLCREQGTGRILGFITASGKYYLVQGLAKQDGLRVSRGRLSDERSPPRKKYRAS